MFETGHDHGDRRAHEHDNRRPESDDEEMRVMIVRRDASERNDVRQRELRHRAEQRDEHAERVGERGLESPARG